MKLFGDFEGMNARKVKDKIAEDYKTDRRDLDGLDILIAAQDEGGYEGSSWFLVRDKKSKQLMEATASHCSCFGFEDQWAPETTTVEYLRSDKFYAYVDGHSDKIKAAVRKVKE